MEEKVYLDKLAKRDIKPTAIRLLILKSMMEAGRAVSQLDLETLLDTVDKSTISRTITLFLSHHLIHSIDDGSGSAGGQYGISHCRDERHRKRKKGEAGNPERGV